MSGKDHNDILTTVLFQLNELKSSTSDGADPLPHLKLNHHPFYCDKEVSVSYCLIYYCDFVVR